MAKYELLYIVHPDLEASIDKITDKARGYIEARKGKITYEENWGKRKLAYPINKAEVGIYVLWYFEAPETALAKIERDMRLTEEVIRYMILATPDKIKVVKAKKTEAKPTSEVAPEAAEKAEVSTTEKKTVAKKTPAKKEAKPAESEKVRMKKLDEQLGALLGDDAPKAKKK